jgi:aldose 1-epimerase
LAQSEEKTKVTAQPFGKLADGTPVGLYTLSDGAYEVRIATYGGIVVSLKAPDRNGKSADLVLQFARWPQQLLETSSYAAAVVAQFQQDKHEGQIIPGQIRTCRQFRLARVSIFAQTS